MLQKFIKVDIYGDCGPLSCGKNRNMGHLYSLDDDPCFDLVNRNYRYTLHKKTGEISSTVQVLPELRERSV